MNDTSPGIEARFNALFLQRSGGDRVRMTCEMFDLGHALMVANIKAENPGITGPELRARIFERTYHDDFNAGDRARIVARLRERVPSR